MSGEIIIRRFNEKDVDEVYDVIHKALHTTVLEKVYDTDSINLWSSFYSKKYILGSSKIKHIYVAEIDNHVVGCIAINEDLNMGYVSMVYIDPTIQGKGIGKALLKEVEKDEIALKTKKLFLCAALSANLFYQKNGYHYKDAIPLIDTSDGLDMIILEKEL